MTNVGERRKLPVISDRRSSADGLPSPSDSPKRPSVDAARARLGGRLEPDTSPRIPGTLRPGDLVRVTVRAPSSDEHVEELGVVLVMSGGEAHVLRDSVSLRRVSRDDLARHDGDDVPNALRKLAGEVRVFGALSERETVRFQGDSGALETGQLVEKCRFGALVLRNDGAIVAVGFRRLWPLEAGGAA